MSYTPPAITSTGLVIPSYQDVLNYLISAYLSTYGSTVYLQPDSADYQDIAIRALQYYNAESAMQQIYFSLNPLTATGPSLDLCGVLIGTPRKSASYSQVVLTLSGTSSTVITNGVVQDTSGNYWNLPVTTTVGASPVTATAQQLGPISAAAGTVINISTQVLGWTAVTNASASTVGNAVESDAAYRARLLIAQAKPSLTLIAGTAAALAALSGVTRSMVYENPTGSTDSLGNPAHSITCVVEWTYGTPPPTSSQLLAAATAIYNNKGIGCLTNGEVSGSPTPYTQSIAVTDANNGSITQDIGFLVLSYLPIYVSLNIHALTGYTTAIQNAIIAGEVNYLNSLSIGQGVVYSELYGAALNAQVSAQMPSFSIASLTMGYQAILTAGSFSSSSTALTVASSTDIANGQVVVGTGIAPNTTVTGSGVSWTLSNPTTAAGTSVTTTATQATVGSYSVVVLSPSGISVGQAVVATGIPLNTVVTSVVGTTIGISLPTTATLSATSITFGVALTFFTLVSSGTVISVPFYEASSSNSSYININMV